MTRHFAIAALLVSAAALTSCTSHTSSYLKKQNAPQQAAAPDTDLNKHAKVLPRAIANEDEDERQEARERNLHLKKAEREQQRSVPTAKVLEGPLSAELDKIQSKEAGDTGLYLKGASVGRQETARIAAFNDADANNGRPWTLIGPSTAIFPVATSRTNFPYVTSGRISALAIDPRCHVNSAGKPLDEEDDDCSLYVGAAGGGIWRTHRPFASNPNWKFISGSFATNAIGYIAIDPHNPETIIVGTGEPNSSADSAAGLGLYRSTDGGDTWQHLSSTLTFAGPSGPVTVADGFNDLSIAQITFDPRNSSTFYVATTLGVRGISATSGGTLSNNMAAPSLYKTTDGGATFTEIWNGGGDNCAPFGGACLSSWGVDNVELDPDDPSIIYASAVDVGIWRSWSADNGGAFTQIFFSMNQANVGSDRTQFAITKKNGKTRIYAATGATGAFAGFPAPQTAFSQVWRIDDAKRPAATLISELAAVVPGGMASAPGGWTLLSSPDRANPYYATYDFCTGQCWYDMGIYTPKGHPDTVFVIGSYNYNEAYLRSNARAVLRSTTAGDPDPNNNNVTFTDMTFDAQTPDPASPDYLTQTTAIHPDQHAFAFAPGNPDLWFEGSDGGLVRSSGQYADISATCVNRGLSPLSLVVCQRVLSAVPTFNYSLNAGLSTLQFQHLAINPKNPLGEVTGGTQDNGTFQFEGDRNVWYESQGGDGGLSGFNAQTPSTRFHTYYGPSPEINYSSGNPADWWYIGDPLANSKESARFYFPIIADPRTDRAGTMFAGLQWVWRTTDNGGDPSVLKTPSNHCSSLDPNPSSGLCGDWVHLGNRRLTGGTISWVSRTSGDTGTLWAGTASGRVYIFTNADATDPSTAGQNEVSDALVANNTTPVRFISGIVIDPKDSNHGWVSYGSYNDRAPAAQTPVPGHVFDVKWDGASALATFTSLDGSGAGSLGDLPVNAMVRDDQTGDLYVATDFTVLRRDAKTGHWHNAGKGLPMVEVSSLSIDQKARVIYAGTHGRSAWQLQLK